MVSTLSLTRPSHRRADRFCLRQFDDPAYLGTQIKYDKAEFEKKINEIYLARNKELVDGYVEVVVGSSFSLLPNYPRSCHLFVVVVV